MALIRNPKTRDYVLISNDEEKARKVGLTLSTKVRGPNGEFVWFSQSPYAALPFLSEGDDGVKDNLALMQQDYESSHSVGSDFEVPAPEGMEYLPFQRSGIEYALKRTHCLIGDEPGLGKTIQAIGMANYLKSKRVLVVCPASVRLNWQREIRVWSTLPDVKTQVILKGKDVLDPEANYVITSYGLMVTMHAKLHAESWDIVVIDEAHFLKSLSAQRTQAAFGGGMGRFKGKGVVKKAKRILALTGTPLPNRPRECFTLARSLCPEAIDWMSYDRFCARFNPSRTFSSGYVDEQVGRLPELQARLRCNFMVRRLKEDVLEDLPDMRYEFTYVESTGAIKEALKKESLLDFSVVDLKKPFADTFGEIATVRREMGDAMAPRVVEHVKYLLNILDVPKVTLFAHHRSVIDTMQEGLSEAGVVLLRGGMSAKAKQESVNKFVLGSERVFIGQLDAAGFGIDGLQHVSSHVVIAEPAWTPGTNEQVIDRCHRIGQHDNVLAQFMLAEGSFNEKVLAKVLVKNQNIHAVLDA